MLRVDGLVASDGLIRALDGVSLDVAEGEIVAVIGPNGAGKTTLMRALTGLLRPTAGSIAFGGRQTAGLRPEAIVALGMSLVPEGRRVFQPLTVRDNLQLGAFLRLRRGEGAAVDQDLARVFALFPRLEERADQLAGSLSGGEQQMLAIGRALMARPRLLLLDEPSMGLAPVLVDLVFEIIRRVNDQGTTILLVEQNALAALNIGNYAYVLETGHIGLQGPAAELADNEEVRNAYLGLA